jgi:allophanate hydrolase subunit 2
MGSRSTYTRAKIGGVEGRALKPGDTLPAGTAAGATRGDVEPGFSCPEALRFLPDPEAPIRAIPGPQDEAFTEEGLRTFFGSEYRITREADRMGCRLEGPEIAHRAGADIVSDAIPLGAVQVPGHRKPIVMLADRQTTGGYTKIAVCTAVGTATLAMRLPGAAVRFARSAVEEGVAELRERARMEARLIEAREERRRVFIPGTATSDSRGPSGSASRGDASSAASAISTSGPAAEGTRAYRITVGGRTYEVTLEEIL